MYMFGTPQNFQDILKQTDSPRVACTAPATSKCTSKDINICSHKYVQTIVIWVLNDSTTTNWKTTHNQMQQTWRLGIIQYDSVYLKIMKFHW